MIRIFLILFLVLTVTSLYATYKGIGLEEVVSQKEYRYVRLFSANSNFNFSSGGWSYGK
jgi:hypothetical protein